MARWSKEEKKQELVTIRWPDGSVHEVTRGTLDGGSIFPASVSHRRVQFLDKGLVDIIPVSKVIPLTLNGSPVISTSIPVSVQMKPRRKSVSPKRDTPIIREAPQKTFLFGPKWNRTVVEGTARDYAKLSSQALSLGFSVLEIREMGFVKLRSNVGALIQEYDKKGKPLPLKWVV